ncbi:MAG: hypothetical protein NTZ48_05680 [Candidatus Omnitrophica bacterium]|nr:hypothetical protein [Candidatus Omnitrophota bacterium]
MIIYKVTNCYQFSRGVEGSLSSIEYFKNTPTTAPPYWASKGYHLFAFTFLADARAYAERGSGGNRVFECFARDEDICTNLLPSRVWEELQIGRILYDPDDVCSLRVHRTTNTCNKVHPYASVWPTGTIMAKKLILLRRLK